MLGSIASMGPRLGRVEYVRQLTETQAAQVELQWGHA